jgi:hypothetical protein
VDSANLELAILQQLRDAQALRTGESEIHLLGNAQLKQREMLRSTDALNNQVQILKPLRIDLNKRSRQEISLFLIVSLQNNPVAADDEGFESLDDFFLRQDRSAHPGLD